MPQVNPKNVQTNAAAADLGLTAGVDASALEDEEAKKKKMLQQQRERMGSSGASVYGDAAMSLFGGAGNL